MSQHPSTQLSRRPPRDVTAYVPQVQETARDGAEGIDPKRLVSALWKRRRQVATVMAIVVLPAAVATFLAEPLYRSTTLVEVRTEPVRVLPYQDISNAGGSSNYLLQMTTQEQILKGGGLLARVSAKLRNSDDPALAIEASRLASRRTIDQVPNSQVFRISYLAPSPEVAATVANAFAEQYIVSRYESEQETRETARAMLERELVDLEERVQVSERELVAYAQEHQLYQMANGQDDLAQDKLSLLSQQQLEAENDVMLAEAEHDTVGQATIEEFPESLVTPTIQQRQEALLQLEHRLTALRTQFLESWPAVVQARNELELVTEQLEREKAAALAQARQQAALDLRAAEAKLRAITAAKTEQEETVLRLQDASIQYNIIRREVETNQKLYEGLLERLNETGIVSGMELGALHVVEPAVPDNVVASPKVVWNLLLASVLGLALGLCIALFAEYWNDTMATIEDVEQVTDLPVLASLPFVSGHSLRALPAATPVGWLLGSARPKADSAVNGSEPGTGGSDGALSDRAMAEAIRTLCASLLLSRSEQPPRVLVVTSAASGEGKTTVSERLGRALADTGARTLVVEGDLRRPAFGSRFGIDERGGLSLFLAGHAAQPTIHVTNHEALFVVGAGPAAPNPVALLNSDRMTNFLKDMAKTFSFRDRRHAPSASCGGCPPAWRESRWRAPRRPIRADVQRHDETHHLGPGSIWRDDSGRGAQRHRQQRP